MYEKVDFEGLMVVSRALVFLRSILGQNHKELFKKHMLSEEIILSYKKSFFSLVKERK